MPIACLLMAVVIGTSPAVAQLQALSDEEMQNNTAQAGLTFELVGKDGVYAADVGIGSLGSDSGVLNLDHKITGTLKVNVDFAGADRSIYIDLSPIKNLNVDSALQVAPDFSVQNDKNGNIQAGVHNDDFKQENKGNLLGISKITNLSFQEGSYIRIRAH